MKHRNSYHVLSIFFGLVLAFSLMIDSSLTVCAHPDAKIQAKQNEYHNLGLEGVENARDLGGYYTEDGTSQIKPGLLFRSAELNSATEQDVALLQRLRVSKIIDLRTKSKAALEPDVEVPGAAAVSIVPLGFPDLTVLESNDYQVLLNAARSGLVNVWMTNIYRQLVEDPKAIEATRQFFHEILSLSDGEAVLWHCSAGKDRTGMMTVFLMHVLGCSEEVYRAEYLNTNYYNDEKMKRLYSYAYEITHDKKIAQAMYYVYGVKEDWLDVALDTIKLRYGGMEAYLKNVIGLTNADFTKLQTRYLMNAQSEHSSIITSPYLDVEKGAWYEDGVRYVSENRIMIGTSDKYFSPNNSATRAEIAQIIYAREGKPARVLNNRYSDVPDGKWYSDAINWCSETNLCAGFTDGSYRPDQAISRQQLVAILYQYAAYLGKDISVNNSLSAFPDAGEVQDYAENAMRWAVANNLIAGTSKGLEPSGIASRSQMAVMIKAFDDI